MPNKAKAKTKTKPKAPRPASTDIYETDGALTVSCEDRNSLYERKISLHRLLAKLQIIPLDHSGGSTQS